MKHKNILLVVFFLTLFVFQQVQADGIVPIVGNSHEIDAAPVSAGILYDPLYVYITNGASSKYGGFGIVKTPYMVV